MDIFQTIHGLFRWAVVLIGVIALIKSVIGLVVKQSYEPIDKKLYGYFNISLIIQFLLGVIVLIYNILSVYDGDSGKVGMAVGHALVMFIAIFLAAIGGGRTRKSLGDGAKFRTQTIFLLITAVLIFVGVLAVPAGWAL